MGLLVQIKNDIFNIKGNESIPIALIVMIDILY
jgi:hypothetical protein